MRSNIRSEYLTAAIGVVAMFALTTLAANADIGVTVNGSAVDISPPAIVEAGRVFVPLRGVFEQLGASVVYSNGAINATGNGRDISLQIGSTQATVNGQQQIIDVAPFIVGESTYVPLRFISEALGDSVSWDDADSIAAIDTGGGPADYYSPGTASYVDTAPPQFRFTINRMCRTPTTSGSRVIGLGVRTVTIGFPARGSRRRSPATSGPQAIGRGTT